MFQINVHHLLASLTYLSGAHKQLTLSRRASIESGQFSYMEVLRIEEIAECAKRLGSVAAALDMPAASASAQRLIVKAGQLAAFHFAMTSDKLGLLIDEISILISATHDELEARLLIALPTSSARLLARDCLFGPEVQETFPQVAYDIGEAANCRAFGCWTASVMHLMRVLECGLEALGQHLGLSKADNWNKALNDIEAHLRTIKRREVGASGEQWAAEAGTHLRFIKNAWRNHAMHPLERYDEERAVLIFENTRAFMRHLALKFSQDEASG